MFEVFDVLLTTYEIVRNDRKQFADARIIRFAGMVIDEAQKIKNHGAQAWVPRVMTAHEVVKSFFF